MKKLKLFLVAAALCLVTAGVFAGKAKFAQVGVYYLNGSYTQVATGGPTGPLSSTPSGSSAKILGTSSYFLYTYDDVSNIYIPLYVPF